MKPIDGGNLDIEVEKVNTGVANLDTKVKMKHAE